MIIDIRDNILLFYQQLLDIPNHRYRSWEHCYSYFQQRHSFSGGEDIDKAALHLAFYLASWGMYRGSSQLLQKDYRVHVPAVRELLDAEYDSLWQLDFDSLNATSQEVKLLFQLVDRLGQIYIQAGVTPTATLMTKILLGTQCCTPAYDQLFVYGVKVWNGLHEDSTPRFPGKFGRKSYLGLIEFYHCNRESLQATQAVIAQRGITYPVMKLIDMYFWNLGYQLSEESDNDLE